MSEQWIVVPSWDRFQHYKDRVPPWIKLYTAELLHDPGWEGLSAGSRGTLVTIWAEYALHKGQLPVEVVSKSLGRSYKAAYLNSLSDAGFIQLRASKPLALTRSREVEVEGEKNLDAYAGEAKQEASPRTPTEEPPEPPRDPKAVERINDLAEHLTRHVSQT